MAFEGHPDQPVTTKLECSATHSEESPVPPENDQEQYTTRKIDIHTVLGILVTSIHRIDSYSIKVNNVGRLWQSLTKHAYSHSSFPFQCC